MDETSFVNLSKPPSKDTNRYKSKKPAPNCMLNTRCYFCEFCDNTSIHGFKFIGERRRYIIEKIWWLLVVTGAIFGSAFLISKAYRKWDTSPIVVNFSTKETSIWSIPFPAVTICTETKMNKASFDYTKIYRKFLLGEDVTPKERDNFNMFQMVCDDLPEDLQERINITNTDIIPDECWEGFDNASFEMGEIECKWLGTSYDCDEMLTTVITSEGYCRTFNMLHYEDIYINLTSSHGLENTKARKWSLQEGYPPDAGQDAYPRRTMLPGVKGGFQIDLAVDEQDLDYLCGELQGFQVTLHHPGEGPNMDKHFRVPLNQVVVVGIKPDMIKTSNDIRSYPPEKRQCYFPGEKVLDIFKIYTQQSCLLECLVKHIFEVCDCSPFYLNTAGSICGPGNKECIKTVKERFLKKDVTSEETDILDLFIEPCGCLPACTSLEFEVETSQIDWDWRKTLHIMNKTDDNPGYHKSRLVVYYKLMQFMTSERNELYGTVDFLANCGGLLGLFCGFSFISSMEILYYLTLRVTCNLKKFGRKVWSGAAELLEDEV